MITVRQIQRLWNGKAYDRLLEQLTAPRPEASGRLLSHITGQVPAAALLVVRLDELNQSYVPLYSELVRTILVAQKPEGGWGDVMTTVLCLRALMCGQGNGSAVDRGLKSLAALQKDEGIWPSMPVRRMPSDAFASAYVLMQLGESEQFRQAVRFEEAVEWFAVNELALDDETKKLWMHARRRSISTHKPSGMNKIVSGLSTAGPGISAAEPSSGPVPISRGAAKSFWDFSEALAS